MTPARLKLAVYLLAAAVALAGAFIAGSTVRGWKEQARFSAEVARHAETMKSISDAAAEAALRATKKAEEQQRKIAALDDQYTRELNHANAENERLRNAVADGTRRLRIQAKCPAGSSGVPATPNGTGVDSGTAVELSPEAGRAYSSLRAGIIADEAKLRACQDILRGLTAH